MQVASLGAGTPKDVRWEEIRVVHDGTQGIAVNTEIQQPNRMLFPQCDDLEVATVALHDEEPGEKQQLPGKPRNSYHFVRQRAGWF